MSSDRIISQDSRPDDLQWDETLRPSILTDFVGQSKVKDNLKIFIDAARMRKEPLDHVLLFGPPGLGKTTLANIIAKEMGANIRATSGPVLERPGDLAGVLTNLEEGDVLFIDEIHRISHVVEEFLYPAIEDFVIDIMIDKGPNARSVKINVPPFTLVGATTRSGLLTAPLRSRFGIVEHLEYYSIEELSQIIHRSSQILKIETDAAGELEIAKRSRGTPRIANRLLRRVRDFAQVKAEGRITHEVADRALKLFNVDHEGLDLMDKRILEYMINECQGGPVGISNLSVGIGEDTETLEEIYEPYLIQQGFLKRTPSGRVATQKAYRHYHKPFPAKNSELF